MRRSLVAMSAAMVLALWPAAAFADATRADPHTVEPGARTSVVVECRTDPGRAVASSPLFGEIELTRTGPGRYQSSVTVPGSAAAGTYAVTGRCGPTATTADLTVVPPGDGASIGRRNGPTYIGVGLLLGGLMLAVLATRRRATTAA